MARRDRVTAFLVDDSSVFRRGLRLVMDGHDHFAVVGEAGSGAEALQHLQTLEGVDLVIVDAVMPGMTGLELTRRLKQACPEMHILMVSVYDGTLYVEDALAAGADGFLPKHKVEDHLLEAVDAVMNGRKYRLR